MDSLASTLRRPCFLEEDDGLASIAEFSGVKNIRYPIFSRIGGYNSSQPRSPHFLEACSLCRKTLGSNRDIFMYRGDMPFCSEDCRREQIEIDDAKEKSLSMKALRKKQKEATSAQQNALSSPDKAQKFRAGTVVAA